MEVFALETLRSELSQLQEAVQKELRRRSGLQEREEMLLRRRRQLEQALRKGRQAQVEGLTEMHSELQQGAHHVRRLMSFAAPAVAGERAL